MTVFPFSSDFMYWKLAFKPYQRQFKHENSIGDHIFWLFNFGHIIDCCGHQMACWFLKYRNLANEMDTLTKKTTHTHMCKINQSTGDKMAYQLHTPQLRWANMARYADETHEKKKRCFTIYAQLTGYLRSVRTTWSIGRSGLKFDVSVVHKPKFSIAVMNKHQQSIFWYAESALKGLCFWYEVAWTERKLTVSWA